MTMTNLLSTNVYTTAVGTLVSVYRVKQSGLHVQYITSYGHTISYTLAIITDCMHMHTLNIILLLLCTCTEYIYTVYAMQCLKSGKYYTIHYIPIHLCTLICSVLVIIYT